MPPDPGRGLKWNHAACELLGQTRRREGQEDTVSLMADAGADKQSRLKRFDKQIEEWFEKAKSASKQELDELLASDDIERLAASAKSFAQRLEEMAEQARLKKRAKQGSDSTPQDQPESTSEEIEQPPADGAA